MELILQHGESSVELIRNFWSSDFLLELETLPLRQRQIKMFGKVHDEPRLTAWFGEPYTYSGISLPKKPIPNSISHLMSKVIEHSQIQYNSVLINRYQNGKDYMGWHRDNEKEIDSSSIASLSFGAARRFKIRNLKTKDVWDIELRSGDLLLMNAIQEDFEHSLPKSLRVKEPRFNLTFRRITPAGELC